MMAGDMRGNGGQSEGIKGKKKTNRMELCEALYKRARKRNMLRGREEGRKGEGEGCEEQ